MGAHFMHVSAPQDGGFPREPSQLQRLADDRFLVCIPDCERSHIMLEATNTAGDARELTLEFNHDPRLAQASPKEHFYYRAPDGHWRRKHLGPGPGPACLTVPLAPGVTRIAGIPWFTYAEYVAYVDSLRDARIHKDIAFTDGEGRFVAYRLRITNPGGAAHKLRVFFGRAAHANESSGYFMAQGIIRWLLSGDPAANLGNIEWTFLLCPDPRAIYEHHTYEEIAHAPYDNGRTMVQNYEDALRGRYHIVLVQHMWNNEHGGLMRRTDVPNLEFESYEFNDPLSREPFDKAMYPEVVPLSPVLSDYLAFWPHWYEYGTDHYFHRNGAYWDWRNPGVLSMFNEITFFGKDSSDSLIDNVQRQGMAWARATAQVYLRFQKEHNYWGEAHPIGPVDVTGACFLQKPGHILLERLLFAAGHAARRQNAAGQPMVIFHKQYAHGLGMYAGGHVALPVPDGVDGFKANAAMDDGCPLPCTLQFTVSQDGVEIWRSRALAWHESQMAHLKLRPGGTLSLAIEGAEGAFGNWGGAAFIRNDLDWQC